MTTKIFINLPVKDLPRAKDFYTALGYSINPQFTNDDAACVVISDVIHVMLLVESYFKTFTRKAVVDAKTTTEVLLCLSAESREEVEGLVSKALGAGGSTPTEAKDLGFMYQHSFEDPDGHTWEVVHMSGMPPQG